MPFKTLNLRILSLLILAMSALTYIPLAHAQEEGEATLGCAAKATNLNLYQRVLRAKILAGVDGNIYENISVRIKFTLLAPPARAGTFSLSDITDGLTLSQTGLSFGLSGSLGFYTECQHNYKIRVRVVATDKASGARLSSATDSLLTITSAGETAATKITPPATPTPTPSATPTPSDPGDEE